MDAQRTPDALTTQDENNIICEKLLGLKWAFIPHASLFVWADNNRNNRQTFSFISEFDTWAEVGLIIDRFQELAPVERVDSLSYSSCAERQMVDLAKLLRVGRLRPADVRAAALEYIKAVKS